MRRIPLVLLVLLAVTTLASCTRTPAGPPERPPLTGALADEEDRRLEDEIEKIPGVQAATVKHTTKTFTIGNSLLVRITSASTSSSEVDAISDAALRILWNTRQFVPFVVNFSLSNSTLTSSPYDLRRLGFTSRNSADGGELRRRYGPPSFEGG